MTQWPQFVKDEIDRGASPAAGALQPLVGCYGDAAAEWNALVGGPALVDRSYRGLIELTGVDRLSWLHNLTTNEVKNLSPGEGNYSFAVNIKGRILFDLVILVREEAVWLDLDSRFLPGALAHFEKYKITEDVVIADRTQAYARFALVGESAKKTFAELGASNVGVMPRFSTAQIELDGAGCWVFRTDFCGSFAVELLVPLDSAVGTWQSLCDAGGTCRAVAVGDDAVQLRRIEAGVPWPGLEITDEYLPAETGQYERAVSRTKGCYLGQEIVERMRSRDVVARRLVGIRLDGDSVPATPAGLELESGEVVGQLTSARTSVGVEGCVGLGYVKAKASSARTALRVAGADPSVCGRIVDLPFAS
ncbi:MAG: folate-binding protein YgfZ [Planctomycetes bacterium]|nr:folate-binding protein YgfZ [Planctomycetota bacterium]